MSTTLERYANETPVPRSTLTELFFEAIDRHGEATALQRFETPERLADLSYPDVLREVMRVGGGLDAHGLARGDRVAILSENRPEWAIVDYACLCRGVWLVPIYPTLLADQIGYLLGDSEVRTLFASTPELAEKALEAVEHCDQDVTVVAMDAGAPSGTVAWDDFLADADSVASDEARARFRSEALSAAPDDVATMLYTSGTTGTPKGVMLTHHNVASNVRASALWLPIGDADNTVSFLPLSHILQRMVDHLFFWAGCTIAYPRSLDTLIVDLKRVAPTVVVSVPRIYEKIYNNVMDAQGLKKIIVGWATKVADRVADLRLAGEEPTGLLGLQYRLADALVFGKVKDAVGGRLRFFVSGGGPLAPALNRFFYSIGLTILEGYGLTETSPVTNVNNEEYFRIGTVGRPIPGTEIRIAQDGEILIRGPQVMKGYYRRPEDTAACIDEDGWFYSGDIGEIDADGFLKITDRKKDIIVTAGGKNIAPQPIENLVKTHPLVEQAVVVGDRRRYCSLLIVPAYDALGRWAREQGISWSSHEDLVANPAVVAGVEKELSGLLQEVASFERPKRIALLAEEFTIENGMLTPKLSVKRRVVQERLEHVIDALYDEEAADQTAY